MAAGCYLRLGGQGRPLCAKMQMRGPGRSHYNCPDGVDQGGGSGGGDTRTIAGSTWEGELTAPAGGVDREWEKRRV